MDKRKRIGIARWSETKDFADSKQVGVVSATLCGNVARPIQQLTIPFEEFGEWENTNEPQASLVRYGKPVVLSNSQLRLVYALSAIITAQRGEEQVKQYIDRVNIEKNPPYLSCIIDTKELTKKVLPGQSIKQRDIDAVIKDLHAIIETKHSIRIGDDEVRQPLFMKGAEKLKYSKDTASGKEIAHVELIQLAFAPIFFYQLGTGFAMIPDKLFEIWGKKGTRTDLFSNLLSQLLFVYGGHHSAYEAATRNARKENKGRTPEETDKIVAKAQRDALTYSEYSETLQGRTTTDYTSTRAQRRRFVQDVKDACEAIKKIGLITDYKTSKTSKGERWDFLLNPDYNKECEAQIEG